MTYKVIRTGDFANASNPTPGRRARIEILTAQDGAHGLNGIFGIIPAADAGRKPSYHYHKKRESIIQILSGDATEMLDGEPVPLGPGDVIFIPPNVKHALLNNSAAHDLKYMEFYTPAGPDVVRVED